MNRSSFLLKLALVFTGLVFISFTALANEKSSGPEPRAKYVFLFIGDGMGQAQVNLTQAYLAALENRIGFNELTFTTFPQVGFVSTYANNQLITCSAAAGTALACGNKTNTGRIGMDTSGTVPFESIAEKAKKEGYKVGILTTVSIDHATPSAFYAHVPDRDMYFEIGRQLTESDFDFFAGGGFVTPEDTVDGKTVNLLELARQNGFNVVNTREGFDRLKPGDGKTLLFSQRVAGEAAMPFYIDMDPADLTLADFTAKGIQLLSNEKGFFMMVEGGKIDWACHGNDAAATIQEVISFDKAVENAYSFYMKHPDETLIIVTADHETGGLALGNYKTKYSSYIGLLKYQKSSVEELNKIVARFRTDKSSDPEADFARMMKVVETEIGLNSRQHGTLLSEEELASLKKLFKMSVYGSGAEDGSYGDYEAFIDAAINLLAEKAGISWGTSAHTAVNVPVYAIGPGAEKLSGYIDNTDIPRIIGTLMVIDGH
jgi:alkaline phosphatase